MDALKFFKLDKLIENLSGLLDTKIELAKLEIKEKVAQALAKLVVIFLLVFLFLLVIAFLSIGASFYLNEVTNSSYLGFLIMAMFYLITALSFYFFADREAIQTSISEKINRSVE